MKMSTRPKEIAEAHEALINETLEDLCAEVKENPSGGHRKGRETTSSYNAEPWWQLTSQRYE